MAEGQSRRVIACWLCYYHWNRGRGVSFSHYSVINEWESERQKKTRKQHQQCNLLQTNKCTPCNVLRRKRLAHKAASSVPMASWEPQLPSGLRVGPTCPERLLLIQMQTNVLSPGNFKAKIIWTMSKTSRANICAKSKYVDGNTFYKLLQWKSQQIFSKIGAEMRSDNRS